MAVDSLLNLRDSTHQYENTPATAGRQLKTLTLSIMAVAWLFLVLVSYYAVHKPFSLVAIGQASVGVAEFYRYATNAGLFPRLASGATNSLADLAVLAGLCMLSFLIGSRVIGLLRLKCRDSLEELVFTFGLGMATLSLVTLVLGFAGVFYPWLAYTVLGTLFVLNLPLAWASWKGFFSRSATKKRPNSATEKLLIGFVVITFVLAFFAARMPPTSWDSLVYHLAAPRLFIAGHGLVATPQIVRSNLPACGEMLYTLALLLRGDSLPQLVHLSFALWTVLGIYALARRYFSTRAAAVSIAALCSVPTFVILSTWTYVDTILSFYTFLAFYALLNYLEVPGGSTEPQDSPQRHPERSSSLPLRAATKNEIGWLLLAGAFVGVSAAVKYTGAASFLGIGAILVWHTHFASNPETPLRRRISALVARLAIVAATSAVVALPWYAKNAIFAGNPVYPFVFGGVNWDSFRASWYGSPGQAKPSLLNLLLVPWDMTVLGTQGTEAFDATIGPLFLMILPLAVFTWRRHKAFGYALSFFVAEYLFWLGTGIVSTEMLQTRLLLPAFAPLSLGVGFVLDRLGAIRLPSFSLQRFVTLALVLVLGLTVLDQTLQVLASDPFPVAVGLQTEEEYLAKRMVGGNDYYLTMSYLNQNLPPSARILFLWEGRSYYSELNSLPDSILDGLARRIHRDGTATGIVAGLRRDSITHVLVNEAGLGTLLASDQRKWSGQAAVYQELKALLRPIPLPGRGYALYEVGR
ncbi:MAG: glycosyltransferase family 39 protein [Chloroflexi bacterium]|nr:glycosyltransferase family 39 protein [Chloroflexota bacterium]